MGYSENKIEKHLIKTGKQLNYMVLKFQMVGVRGVPDRIIIGKKITFFIELKAPGKTLQLIQKKKIDEMRNHGAIIYVIDNKEDINKILEHHTKYKKTIDIGIY